MAAAFAALFYALCNATDPLQTGFSLAANTVRQDGLCVTWVAEGSPLELQPCVAGAPAQAFIYEADGALSTPPGTNCSGVPGGACISWNGQEHGECTFSPPRLGPGCVISGYRYSAATGWNGKFLPDSPAAGMIQGADDGAGHAPSGLCASARPPPPLPTPTADVLAWSRREVMCLYDIDMCTFVGSQGCDCAQPPPPVDAWAPTALDADSWLQAGVAAGCAIHILVAKHMCGFVSWNSTAGAELGYNYSSFYSSTPVDAVDAFVRAARALDQRVGMYYSLTDNARTNTCLGTVRPNPAPGQVSVTPAQYDALVKAHLTELWTHYGVLDEIWFDGGFTASQKAWIPDLLAALQPHAVAFNGETLSPNPTRWIGSESGYAPNETWSTCDYEQNGSGGGDPNSLTWFPAETDFTVLASDTWFFDTIHAVRPPAQLRAMYEASVGHNSQALIGIGIPPNGTLVGTAQDAALRGLGAYITGCYGTPIAQTSGRGLSFAVMPSAPVAIDRVVLSEDQTTGQRVRAWALSATLADGSTVPLGAGQSIGNKRIVVLPQELRVALVTLDIGSAVGTPVLANMAIFGGCGVLAAALDARA